MYRMNSNRYYLLTGAAGFLGSNIYQQTIHDEVQWLIEEGLIEA